LVVERFCWYCKPRGSDESLEDYQSPRLLEPLSTQQPTLQYVDVDNCPGLIIVLDFGCLNQFAKICKDISYTTIW
jgi:hypothetical protein